MKEQTSQIFQLKQGPHLLVCFHSRQEEIVHVDLTTHAEKGLSWSLSHNVDQPNSLLLDKINDWMTMYSQGTQPSLSLPLCLNWVSSFNKVILETLQLIPFGQATTYGALAALAGRPKAARAVGNACGSNPMPLVIPCHRVLASNMRFGGFSLNPSIKKTLLDFEKITFS